MPAEIAKPPFGQPCNGCGLCCKVIPCAIARIFWDEQGGPCRALEEAGDGRHVCGLAVAPERYRPARTRSQGAARMKEAMKVMLGAGLGCDQTVEGEPRDPEFLAMLARTRPQRLVAARRARKVLGV